MAKKKIKEAPFGSCPHCWTNQAHQLPSLKLDEGNPNIIVIGESPLADSGKCGALFSSIWKKTDARPIFLKARQCNIFGEVTLDEIKRNREHFLLPTLEKFPGIPIVAFGGYAAMMVAGGKCTDTSMVNKSYEMYDRVCAFTYHPKYYIDGFPVKNTGRFMLPRDERTLETMIATVNAALQPIEKLEYSTIGFPTDIDIITLDNETTDKTFPWYGSKTVEIGILDAKGKAWTIRPEEITQGQKDFLGLHVSTVVGHNLAFDLLHCAYLGINLSNARYHDTLIYQKNIKPNEWFYGLKPLVKKYYNYPHYDAWFNSILLNKQGVENCDYEKLCNYNVHDLYATYSLYEQQKRAYPPFTLEMDYLRYVIKLIQNGMFVDKQRLDRMLTDTYEKLATTEKFVREEFALGPDFNFNSPPQVLNLLQKEIPKIKGTGAPVLMEYEDSHPFVNKLLEIRDLAKLGGTGLEGLKEYIDADSLVHTSLSVHGAETGRSSSSNPNLQNTDPRVRSLFVSRYEGGRLIHTDLSGIEYRLIAHISRDTELLRTFNSGEDIHTRAFTRIFGRPPNDKTERKIGKTCNFLGVYGGGYSKFLVASGLPDNDASRKAFKSVSGLYPGVERWKKEVIKQLYDTHTVRNLFGRSREFLSVSMADQREAINWMIQSSGHDILKIYSMEMCDSLELYNLHRTILVSEVHDSNTFDSPAEEYTRAAQLISTIAKDLNPLIDRMFGVKMRIPIIAEVEVLDKWV